MLRPNDTFTAFVLSDSLPASFSWSCITFTFDMPFGRCGQSDIVDNNSVWGLSVRPNYFHTRHTTHKQPFSLSVMNEAGRYAVVCGYFTNLAVRPAGYCTPEGDGCLLCGTAPLPSFHIHVAYWSLSFRLVTIGAPKDGDSLTMRLLNAFRPGRGERTVYRTGTIPGHEGYRSPFLSGKSDLIGGGARQRSGARRTRKGRGLTGLSPFPYFGRLSSSLIHQGSFPTLGMVTSRKAMREASLLTVFKPQTKVSFSEAGASASASLQKGD